MGRWWGRADLPIHAKIARLTSPATSASVVARTPRALRFLAAEMKMAEATLGEIERDGLANLQQRRISLTPLRKLWISWKTVRFG